MKNKIQQSENTIYFICGLLAFACFAFGMFSGFQLANPPKSKLKINPEYVIELVNNDTVKIQAIDSDEVYTVSYDSITQTLLNDNL